MKRTIVLAASMLAGCGEAPSAAPGGGAPVAEVTAAADEAAPDGRIACAPPGEAEFRAMCSVDRVADAEGTVLTLRLPDGGFHRVRVSADGRDIVAADGAEPAVVRTGGGQVEVEIGGARFRLPAAASAVDAPG